MYGYADESGEPGVMKNEHDYFVFCIVLFDNRQKALECSSMIDAFRRTHHLSETHEFHYSKDSRKTRAAFGKFIRKQDFAFVSAAIKKNHLRNTASYRRMSELVLDVLSKKHISADIIMDKNPRLYKELRTHKKYYHVELHFVEKESRGNNPVQLADYVTAFRARFLKYPSKAGVAEQYSNIANKSIGSVEI